MSLGMDMEVLKRGRVMLLSFSSPELEGELDEKMFSEPLDVVFDAPFCSSYHLPNEDIVLIVCWLVK